MKVSKRRTGVNLSPIYVASHRRVNDPAIDLKSEEIPLTKCIGLVSRDLLVTSFSLIRPNIWYSVVPENDDTSNISSRIRQTWANIMSVLIHCGLIKKMAWQAMVLTLSHQNGTNFVRHFQASQSYIIVTSERRVRTESSTFV